MARFVTRVAFGGGQPAPAPPTAPAAPTISGITAGNGQLSIAFTDGATGGSPITGHKVYGSTTSGFTPGPGNLLASSGASSPALAAGLANGVTFYLRLSAVNGIGEGAFSAETSGTPTLAQAKTTFPTSGSVVYELDPDAVTGVANGARVTSVPNAASGITASAPSGSSGPQMLTGAANGHQGLAFTGSGDERLTIPRASVASVMGQPLGWSVVITFKGSSYTGTNQKYAAMLSDEYNGGFFMAAGDVQASIGDGGQLRSFDSADPAANIHTYIYSGEAGGVNGRLFLDGTMWMASQPTALKSGGPDVSIGGMIVNGSFFAGFKGTILNIRIISAALSPAECLQAHFWACTRFGKALPITGRSFFPVMDGDSITFGTNANSGGNGLDAAYPAQLARKRGWPMGAFANVGKPSCFMAAGSNSGYNMMDHAGRDVDGFADVTGLPVVLISNEWYNQGAAGGTTAQGTTTADNNRAYAAARAATGKFSKHIHWTSVSCDRQGGQRDGFNASLVANHPNMDAVIPVHTDATMGVDNAYQNTTNFDGVTHPTAAGYALLTNLIDAGLTGAGVTG